MGWENETGRMDYKFFWGGEGDTPFMTALRQWASPGRRMGAERRSDALEDYGDQGIEFLLKHFSVLFTVTSAATLARLHASGAASSRL